jgi:hypothetical protein
VHDQHYQQQLFVPVSACNGEFSIFLIPLGDEGFNQGLFQRLFPFYVHITQASFTGDAYLFQVKVLAQKVEAAGGCCHTQENHWKNA